MVEAAGLNQRASSPVSACRRLAAAAAVSLPPAPGLGALNAASRSALISGQGQLKTQGPCKASFKGQSEGCLPSTNLRRVQAAR